MPSGAYQNRALLRAANPHLLHCAANTAVLRSVRSALATRHRRLLLPEARKEAHPVSLQRDAQKAEGLLEAHAHCDQAQSAPTKIRGTYHVRAHDVLLSCSSLFVVNGVTSAHINKVNFHHGRHGQAAC